MATMEYIVDVSRYAASAKTGTDYSQVRRTELLDKHLAAAKATFEELKARFPAAEGFKPKLLKREVMATAVASRP